MAAARHVNRNVTGAKGHTSIRLELEFWQALGEYGARERVSADEMIQGIDRDVAAGGRTSAIRVRLLEYYRAAATEAGHAAAGHGATGRLNR